MTIEAVIFDFAGTLFRMAQNTTSWTDDAGAPMDQATRETLIHRLTTPDGAAIGLRGEYLDAFERRDLDPTLHRKAYLEVLRQSGVSDERVAETIYASTVDVDSWVPYPDTEQALRASADAGLAVGVLSNIAWDIRPAFAALGLEAVVDEFVLSYEVGVIKPDPAVFRLMLRRLGVAAERTLMVGDSPGADGAATRLGCAFARVDPLPPAERQDALLAALREQGVL